MALLRFLTARRSFFFAVAGALFIIGGTVVAIRWAQGYRPSLQRNGPRITGTGLFVATSTPKGAQVLLNGKLTTATDDTLNLPPGSYDVELQKDGYSPWKKTLTIAAELVTQTNGRLFPAVANLTPLTFTGAREPLPSPDGQKIVYKVSGATPSAKNGIWEVDLVNRNLPIARASAPRQLARDNTSYDFLDATLVWTPDSNQLLAYWKEDGGPRDEGQGTREIRNSLSPQLFESEPLQSRGPSAFGLRLNQAVLLSISGMNDEAALRDATSRLPVLASQWHEDMDLAEEDRLKRLPREMQEIATSSATSVFFSPDETKVLYAATERREIPETLVPDLPSESTQKEERILQEGGIYIYDLKEDRNYRVGTIEVPEKKGLKELQPKKPTKTISYWETRLTHPEAAAPTPSSQSLPPVPSELLGQALALLSSRYSPVFTLPLQWFPTSAHLLKRTDTTVSIIEYDGTNDATVYAGPFDASFVYPWPDGSRVLIATDFNRSSVQNLYTIALE